MDLQKNILVNNNKLLYYNILYLLVSSGTVTVNDDSSVQILAEEAVTIDMLDRESVREGLVKAQQDLSSSGSDEVKAENQIALECWEALNKALDEK